MSVTRVAVKVPMKKLFAVVTLVGAASGTAIAVSSTPTENVECGRVAVEVVETVAVAPIQTRDPVEDIVNVEVIAPLTLTTGSPACGNMAFKGGGPPPCPPPVKAAKATIESMVIAPDQIGYRGAATRAKPRTFGFRLGR